MSRIGISRGIVVWSLAIFLAQPFARAQEGKFGEVNFPISCSAAAQTQFNRAVAMLHSFFFPETVKAFTALAQQEPSCAMAYWGIAISQRPNPLVAPFPAELMDKGWQAIEAGRVAAGKNARQRSSRARRRSSTSPRHRDTAELGRFEGQLLGGGPFALRVAPRMYRNLLQVWNASCLLTPPQVA